MLEQRFYTRQPFWNIIQPENFVIISTRRYQTTLSELINKFSLFRVNLSVALRTKTIYIQVIYYSQFWFYIIYSILVLYFFYIVLGLNLVLYYSQFWFLSYSHSWFYIILISFFILFSVLFLYYYQFWFYIILSSWFILVLVLVL